MTDLFRRIPLLCALLLAGHGLWGQANVSPATAKVISAFPHVENNVNTANGGTATGMLGSCFSLPCCSVLVYKVVLPNYGSLRVKASNISFFSGSIIAYIPTVSNPTHWSELLFYPGPGNFCGFRDSLQLGLGYNWASETWSSANINNAVPPGEYYLLFFNENQQASLGIGSSSELTFDFVPFCPPGFNCALSSATICDGDGFQGPSGKIYTNSGSYQDTLMGGASGGLDSLTYLSLTVNHTALMQDSLQDEILCPDVDTLQHEAYTEMVAFAQLDRVDNDWIAIDTVANSIAGSSRSVFLWMRKTTSVLGSSQMLLAINRNTGSDVCHLQVGTNDELGVFDGNAAHYTGVTVTDGNWHLVGYTYNETTDSTHIYVDGILQTTYVDSQTVSASDKISIGQEYDAGLITGNFYDGQITEVSIWNEVLSPSEVNLLHKQAIDLKHPQYAALQAYYPMNLNCEADFAVVADFSGHGWDGLASATDLQSQTGLAQIPGFNSAPHFEKRWMANDSIVSNADKLILSTFQMGAYELQLNRDFLTFADTWVVSPDSSCICVPTQSTIHPITCNSYLSPSGKHTWTTSGSYVDTLANAGGCDSVVTVNLTIKPASTYVFSDTTCGSYLSPSGKYLWTTTNGYLDTLTNAVGCDSIIIVYLTVYAPSSATINPVACGNYLSPSGKYTWTSSGSYLDTVSTKTGCDSIVTVNLTVNAPTTATINPVVCGSYLSPSGKYLWTSSNTYLDTLVNAEGCDSLVLVNLTIKDPATATISPTVCESYLSPSGKYIWNSSGTYLDTLVNAEGCDSIVTVNLTVKQIDVNVSVSEGNLTANAIEGEFRWFDCWSGYTPIPNETGPSFTTTEIGSYAVEIMQNGCVDTSACTEVLTLSLDEKPLPVPVVVYPNPSQGPVFLDWGKPAWVSVQVTDAKGRTIHQTDRLYGTHYQFVLDAAPGLYFIELRSALGSTTVKLLKQ